MPGATLGLPHEDRTIAALLKTHGYATGQFGKNHLGDRNEFLPTVHGFDEFYGALHHLNAAEEPELPDYPKNEGLPELPGEVRTARRAAPLARTRDDKTVDPRFGKVGKQGLEDTGPLNKKRMVTIDDDIADRRSPTCDGPVDNTPFFSWVNFTHMHFGPTRSQSLGQAGPWQSRYHDTMIDHDKNIGPVLDPLDDRASPTTPS